MRPTPDNSTRWPTMKPVLPWWRWGGSFAPRVLTDYETRSYDGL